MKAVDPKPECIHGVGAGIPDESLWVQHQRAPAELAQLLKSVPLVFVAERPALQRNVQRIACLFEVRFVSRIQRLTVLAKMKELTAKRLRERVPKYPIRQAMKIFADCRYLLRQ